MVSRYLNGSPIRVLSRVINRKMVSKLYYINTQIILNESLKRDTWGTFESLRLDKCDTYNN